MFWHHPPRLLQDLFPEVVWHLPAGEEEAYLSFDDGPDDEITPRLLDWLGERGLHATFFCVGKQVERHPVVFERIVREGHAVGNHTYSHPDGWRTPLQAYLADVERAHRLLNTPLFRPPYGRLTPAQMKALKKRFTIVMWDLMPGDYEQGLALHTLDHRLQRHLAGGSLVVGHASHSPLRTHLHHPER